MADVKRSVVNLDQIAGALPDSTRDLFARLFRVTTTQGGLTAPPSMHKWIEGLFGSLAAVQNQRIIKVTNVVTLEEALFNQLRAQRPIEAKEAAGLREMIDESRGGPFCRPEEGTPADVFGRLKGEHSITASNIAKYDGFHGVVIFDEHDPLVFSQDDVVDYINTSEEWLKAAHSTDPTAIYPFILWNCLWKSGSSITHGHFQVLLGRGSHYGKVEGLRLQARSYRERYGSGYFEDLWSVHQALGLGSTWEGIRIYPYLTAIKEKEVFIAGSALDDNMKAAIFKVADCYVHQLGVTSFNMAIYLPPMEKTGEDWSDVPVLVRFVDRGDPLNKTADFGAMELFAASVVSSDPFRVADALQDCFK